METAIDILPDDPVLLRAMVLAMRSELVRVTEQNARLELLVSQLQRMQFGKRSEKLAPDQFNIELAEIRAALEAQPGCSTSVCPYSRGRC